MMDEGRHDKEKKKKSTFRDSLQLIEFCTAYK